MGSSFVDPGATADGGETVSVLGTVDANVVNIYTNLCSYRRRKHRTKDRTVNVTDTTAQQLMLLT